MYVVRILFYLFPKAYSLGYDYAHGDSNPFPAYNLYRTFPTRESHGTHVAGIITAAKDNGVCGVGGAYDATLTGIIYSVLYFTHTFAHSISHIYGK